MADQSPAPAPADASPAAPAAPARRGKALLAAALAGSLAIGGALGVLVAGPLLATQKGYVLPAADSAGAPGDAHAADGQAGAAGHEGGSSTAIHAMDNLVLNPAGSNGTRFLMVNLAIQVRDEKASEEIAARDAEARDAVLRVLGARTVEQLSDVAQRDAIRGEVHAALTALFSKDAVRRLYFPQFVIQ